MATKIVVVEHTGWPERRTGILVPGLHKIPQPGREPVSVVSLDNGELHAVESASVFTPEGLRYAEGWAVQTHKGFREIRVPDALKVK
jgi:hypothetical protein